MLPRGQLVDYQPQRPDVRRERVTLPRRPLWRPSCSRTRLHVHQRPDEGRRHRHRLLQLLADPEIRQLNLALAVYQHVLRLDVPVQLVLLVVQVREPHQHLVRDRRQELLIHQIPQPSLLLINLLKYCPQRTLIHVLQNYFDCS